MDRSTATLSPRSYVPTFHFNLQELASLMDLRYNFDSLEEYLTTGEKVASDGRLDEAVGVLREAINRYPESAIAHYDLGTALLMAVSADKARHEFWEDLADEEVLTEEAIDVLQSAIDLAPDMVPAYNNLARVLAVQGRAEDAIAVWERSLVIDANQQEIRADLEMFRTQIAADADELKLQDQNVALEDTGYDADDIATGKLRAVTGTDLDETAPRMNWTDDSQK